MHFPVLKFKRDVCKKGIKLILRMHTSGLNSPHRERGCNASWWVGKPEGSEVLNLCWAVLGSLTHCNKGWRLQKLSLNACHFCLGQSCPGRPHSSSSSPFSLCFPSCSLLVSFSPCILSHKEEENTSRNQTCEETCTPHFSENTKT